MKNDLEHWLAKEIEYRGWSIRELARRADLSHTAISNVLSRQRRPGWDLCFALAYALKLPPEAMFRKARLLPPKPEINEMTEEVLHLFEQLSKDKQKFALQSLRAWVENK